MGASILCRGQHTGFSESISPRHRGMLDYTIKDMARYTK